MRRCWLLSLVLLIAHGAIVAPASGQTPMATPATGRTYENTCDGAQAWFDDMHIATDALFESGTPIPDVLLIHLDYYRNSNPPPILDAWIDAVVTLYANLTDYGPETDYMALLEAIEDAEEDLADLCGDHEFTENF